MGLRLSRLLPTGSGGRRRHQHQQHSQHIQAPDGATEHPVPLQRRSQHCCRTIPQSDPSKLSRRVSVSAPLVPVPLENWTLTPNPSRSCNHQQSHHQLPRTRCQKPKAEERAPEVINLSEDVRIRLLRRRTSRMSAQQLPAVDDITHPACRITLRRATSASTADVAAQRFPVIDNWPSVEYRPAESRRTDVRRPEALSRSEPGLSPLRGSSGCAQQYRRRRCDTDRYRDHRTQPQRQRAFYRMPLEVNQVVEWTRMAESSDRVACLARRHRCSLRAVTAMSDNRLEVYGPDLIRMRRFLGQLLVLTVDHETLL